MVLTFCQRLNPFVSIVILQGEVGLSKEQVKNFIPRKVTSPVRRGLRKALWLDCLFERPMSTTSYFLHGVGKKSGRTRVFNFHDYSSVPIPCSYVIKATLVFCEGVVQFDSIKHRGFFFFPGIPISSSVTLDP